MSGVFVPAIPAAGFDPDAPNWDVMASECQGNPGEPMLAAESVSYSQIKSLRQRRRPPFITSNGRIVISQRGMFTEPVDGKRYADVYFTWQPNEPTTEEAQ